MGDKLGLGPSSRLAKKQDGAIKNKMTASLATVANVTMVHLV